MNTPDFLKKCAQAFPGKELTEDQVAIYTEKLARFDERQLNRIHAEIIETCKYFPKIADIYDAARSMGMLTVPEQPIHHWQPTACGLCHGEGRLLIVWQFRMEE